MSQSRKKKSPVMTPLGTTMRVSSPPINKDKTIRVIYRLITNIVYSLKNRTLYIYKNKTDLEKEKLHNKVKKRKEMTGNEQLLDKVLETDQQDDVDLVANENLHTPESTEALPPDAANSEQEVKNILSDGLPGETPIASDLESISTITGESRLVEAEHTKKLFIEEGSGIFFKYRIFGMEGSNSHDYQDAAKADPKTGFVAIADGTTLGGYSEIVSQELVKRFVGEKCDLSDKATRDTWWLETRKIWYAAFRAKYNEATSVEQSRWDKGGSSTFMGLKIGNDQTYGLYNIGDCSLFWFLDPTKELIRIDGAKTFNSHPNVLHTEDSQPHDDLTQSHILNKMRPGNFAILTTDAVAKFFIETEPWVNNDSFWNLLLMEDQEKISDWLLHEKSTFRLEPDDFTFIVLDFQQQEIPESCTED